MDLNQALNIVIGEITPQPWDWTTPDGGITLTVIPAGLRADPGDAEVIVRIGAIGQFFDVEAGIPSRDLPVLIDAISTSQAWSYETLDGVGCTLTPLSGGGALLALSPDHDDVDDQPQIVIPEQQRLPLASALGRAGDVARGWED